MDSVLSTAFSWRGERSSKDPGGAAGVPSGQGGAGGLNQAGKTGTGGRAGGASGEGSETPGLERSKDEGACGCATPGASSGQGTPLGLALLLLAARRRPEATRRARS